MKVEVLHGSTQIRSYIKQHMEKKIEKILHRTPGFSGDCLFHLVNAFSLLDCVRINMRF